MRSAVLTAALLFVSLVACHRGPYHGKPVAGPDGQPGWYRIDCGKDRMECVERAGQTCPRGYETGGTTTSKGEAYAVPINGMLVADQEVSNAMLVKCHDAPTAVTSAEAAK